MLNIDSLVSEDRQIEDRIPLIDIIPSVRNSRRRKKIKLPRMKVEFK